MKPNIRVECPKCEEDDLLCPFCGYLIAENEDMNCVRIEDKNEAAMDWKHFHQICLEKVISQMKKELKTK